MHASSERSAFYPKDGRRPCPFPPAERRREGLAVGSPTGQLLEVFGIPRPLNGDLRRRAIDVTQIIGRQLDRRRADVLFQARELRGPWDRNDPRLLRQKPRQGELSACHLLS